MLEALRKKLFVYFMQCAVAVFFDAVDVVLNFFMDVFARRAFYHSWTVEGFGYFRSVDNFYHFFPPSISYVCDQARP